MAATLLLFLGNFEVSHASRNYGVAGCGLDSLLMGRGGIQFSAATTNSSSGSQSFGITSGTSNCLSDEEYATLQIQEQFVLDNYQTLAKQMAQGGGDTLVAFSVTLGCNAESVPYFSQLLQENYADMVGAPGALALLETVRLKVVQDQFMEQNCHKLLND
jgi:hypothetical protein